MTDLTDPALIAAVQAGREIRSPYDDWDDTWDETIEAALEAAAPHITAAAVTAEHERMRKFARALADGNDDNLAAIYDQVIRTAMEAERARLREPIATLTDWLEHLPQRHVPLRAAEALLRLRNLTTPGDTP